MLCFIHNSSCRVSPEITTVTLATDELLKAEQHWVRRVQQLKFGEEIATLSKGNPLSHSSKLLPLHPILDEQGLLRVDGRVRHSEPWFGTCHPILLPGNHSLTTLLLRTEHLRLRHVGPTLVTASLSLSRCFYIV